MHVGSSQRDIAQRRRLELTPVRFVMGNSIKTLIGNLARLHADADVMELVVGNWLLERLGRFQYGRG